jgi:glycine/D-amino acid oxidase-like deaminating enzyme
MVGGGIIGLSAALFLARAGLSVVVCEKGEFGGEQSSRNWGWVRRMGRDPRELPLAVESLKLWDTMPELVGRDVGFRRSGILYLCETEAQFARHEDWLRQAGEFVLDTRMVRGDALADLLPGASRSYAAALYTPSDGRAEPQHAVPAIAAGALAAGATLLANCAVLEVEPSGGSVSGVVTERGRIAASTVVIAGGVWSTRIARTLGVRLPQLGIRSSVMRTAPIEGGPGGAGIAGSFAYRRRLDGGYTIAPLTNTHDIVPDSFRYFRDFLPAYRLERHYLDFGIGGPLLPTWGTKSPFIQTRILDPGPDMGLLRRTQAALTATFPIFEGVAMAEAWGGIVDVTPDAIPVISPVASRPGLVLATGFSGHGFGIGPGAGRLTADLVLGAAPVVDPAPFRHDRFIDGSWA